MVVNCRGKSFGRLRPLHSTRTEVERLLGSPTKSKGVVSTFETKDGRVIVFYSCGDCKEKASNGWKLPRDTVVSIIVHPNRKLLVRDLKLDKMKYERILDEHVQGVVYYFSKTDGVRISARILADQDEDIDSITYEPSSEDDQLRCAQ